MTEHACKWKKNERTWMHLEMKMKGKWKDINTNERNMKGIFKGKWRDMNTNWKDDGCKWRKMHANECNMKGTWSVAQTPESIKTTPRSSIHFWACLGCILASCWISNMLISIKPWKAIGPPKSDNHNNSNYSGVKDFDWSSYIYTNMSWCSPMCVGW